MVVGCANPVLVDMLGVECLSAAFSGVSALRGLAALLGDHPANHYRSACHFPIFVYMFIFMYIFNFGHLGWQNSLPTQECQATTTYLPPLDLSQWGACFLLPVYTFTVQYTLLLYCVHSYCTAYTCTVQCTPILYSVHLYCTVYTNTVQFYSYIMGIFWCHDIYLYRSICSKSKGKEERELNTLILLATTPPHQNLIKIQRPTINVRTSLNHLLTIGSEIIFPLSFWQSVCLSELLQCYF